MSELFQVEPAQWGLRGDPFLWAELKAHLGHQAYPPTEADFKLLLEKTCAELIGRPITTPGPVLIERYSQGGMSSGQVDPQFWLETGLPWLLQRYRVMK
jgi:hypothetical protein